MVTVGRAPESGLLLRTAVRVRRSGFLRNVAILISGTALGQAISVGAAPILSRLYDPAAFGVLGLIGSTISILEVMVTWRYEMAVVLAKTEEEAANVLALALGVTILMSTLCLLLVGFGGTWFAERIGSPVLGPLMWWVPLSIFVGGIYRSLNYWSTRRAHFRRLSISRVTHSSVSTGVQILTGTAGAAGGGLVAGLVTGQTMASLVLSYQVWRDDAATIARSVRWQMVRRAASEYRDFPKYNGPQALLSTASRNITILFLAYFFSPASVGLYVLANRILKAPLQLIGDSVKQVFFPKASEVHSSGGDSHRLLLRFTLLLASLGILPAMVIAILGPGFFAFALGPEWREAGTYARWLAPWLFMAFLNPPALAMAQVLRKQRELLIYDFTLLVARVSALLVGGVLLTAIGTIALFSMVGLIFNAVLIGWVMVCTRRV